MLPALPPGFFRSDMWCPCQWALAHLPFKQPADTHCRKSFLGVVSLTCLRCSWRCGKSMQMRWRSRCACCWRTMRCCRPRWQMSGLAWPTSGPAQQAGSHLTSFVMTNLFGFLAPPLGVVHVLHIVAVEVVSLPAAGCMKSCKGKLGLRCHYSNCSAPALSASLSSG